MVANGSTKLVISAATGYGPDDLRPFLASLAEHAPDARVCLIVGDLPQEARDSLHALNPNLVLRAVPDGPQRMRFGGRLVRKIWKRVRRRRWLHPLMRGWLRHRPWTSTTALLHIALARYFFARHLLVADFPGADYIMLSDSRDVFFQADPFAGLAENALVTGLEDPAIRECQYNRGWIADLYGTNGLDRLGDKRIICSGVTLGSRSRMLEYLDAMCAEVIRCLPVCAYHGGYDQGIHNRLIHEGHVADVELVENPGPTLATMHHTSVSDYRLDEAQGLMTRGGVPVAIVHQYDRKPELVRWVGSRWA